MSQRSYEQDDSTLGRPLPGEPTTEKLGFLIGTDDEFGEDLAPDFEEEINSLDILEHLEKRGLSEVELVFVERALGFSPVVLAALRRQEWQFICLSEAEFKQMNLQLLPLRGKVMTLLRHVGLSSRWIETMVGKSKGYNLHVEAAGQEPNEKAEIDPKAGLKHILGPTAVALMGDRISGPDGKRPRVLKRSAHNVDANTPTDFTEDGEEHEIDLRSPAEDLLSTGLLLNTAKAVIKTGITDSRLAQIARVVADEINQAGGNITRLEARGALLGLVDSGELFFGSPFKGQVTLFDKPPTGPIQRRRTKKQYDEGLKDSVDASMLTIDDVEAAGRIFETLFSAGHQNKGIELQDLLLEDPSGVVIGRLIKAGVLRREIGWVRSRSPHSKKSQATYLRFIDQATWTRCKQDPQIFMNSLLVLP